MQTMLRDECQHFFYLHEGKTPAETLSSLAAYCAQHNIRQDCYGEGDVIKEFETQLAELLGKQAAVFMPSGTMAQQIAMRIWSERRENNTFACHPTCHMELNEFHGYQHLHGLRTCLLGDAEHLFTLADLQNLETTPAALLIELPQRWMGGQLPTWEELEVICKYARQNDIALHLDGARIWECMDYYERSLADICALFDSVYVSFYKTLGGICGAMLLGEQSFIDESRIWLRRHGGNLYQLYPYVVSAKLSLEKHLPKIPAYCRRAAGIAGLLNNIDDISTLPAVPVTNMMHVYFPYGEKKLDAARDEIARKHGVWMCSRFREGMQGSCYMELFVGENLLAMTDSTLNEIFHDFIKYCQIA